jgi:hypothetical protein
MTLIAAVDTLTLVVTGIFVAAVLVACIAAYRTRGDK